MKNIILINCFFGKFPWYFNLFLKSCGYNPTIDFIIFSDGTESYKVPENVKIIPFTLEKFNILATEKLGFGVNINKAYKLCDFKPAYGVIFSEFIKNYTFWGITDIDIVFGRIRAFMTDDLLSRYEVISVRNDYPTGSFMLFKNNNKINNLFKKSRDFKKVFTSDTHYCFDECNFRHGYLEDGGDIFDIECEIESMHHIVKKEESDNNLKVHFDFLIIEGLPGQLKWEKGLMSFKEEFEVLLYHLILYKSNRYTNKKTIKPIPNKFYIDKYLVRKDELNSVRGIVKNALYNKAVPYLKKFLFKLDFFLSKKINLKINNSEIKDTISSRLTIVTSKESENLQMVRSVLFKRNFFIPFIPNARYQLKKDNELIRIKLNADVHKVIQL